jgi:serine/threonine protein kinase
MLADALPSEQTFTGKVVLGRYYVVFPLGKGGQGEIYLARAEGAAGVVRPVVIKRVHAPLAKDKEARSRFVREARITARLRHPDIVSIVEFERESDDSYLMVLEYVHGYDLWRWMRFVHATRGRAPAQLLAYVATRVLDALHYSHTLREPDGTPAPIIHRDVSAGNVLIDVTGQVKLSDFGIAAVMPAGRSSDGHDHGLIGKLGYIAPELYRGASASPASDIYACGVTLHTLLGGRNEFQAYDVHGAEDRALQHIATPLDRLRDDVSAAAAAVIARALAKDPAGRFPSAAAFAAELRRCFALDLAEMREEFARVVERDFEDPSFAERLGVRSLRTIDSAWRRQESEAPSDSLRSPRSTLRSLSPKPVAGSPGAGNELPTQSDPAGAPAAAPLKPTLRPRGRRRWFEALGWSAAIALLVALVVVVVTLRLPAGSSAQRVLYVEAQPLPVAEIAAPMAAPTAHPDAPSAQRPAPSAKPTGNKLRTSESRLTERFAQQRAEVSRCFQSAPGAQGLARLAITFEIDPSGRVQHAELEPAAVGPGPLERCLLRVARTTRFGAQPGYLRFRIPINTLTHTARR